MHSIILVADIPRHIKLVGLCILLMASLTGAGGGYKKMNAVMNKLSTFFRWTKAWIKEGSRGRYTIDRPIVVDMGFHIGIRWRSFRVHIFIDDNILSIEPPIQTDGASGLGRWLSAPDGPPAKKDGCYVNIQGFGRVPYKRKGQPILEVAYGAHDVIYENMGTFGFAWDKETDRWNVQSTTPFPLSREDGDRVLRNVMEQIGVTQLAFYYWRAVSKLGGVYHAIANLFRQ